VLWHLLRQRFSYAKSRMLALENKKIGVSLGLGYWNWGHRWSQDSWKGS